MSNIVAKFGGTSVKTAVAIRQVARILISNNDINTVVVSAVGGVTNKLIEFCHQIPSERWQLVVQIKAIHLQLAMELSLSINELIEVKIIRLYEHIEVDIFNAEQIDYIVALGEDLSSIIVHAFLQKQGMKIELIDARQLIITDDHFGKATPDLEIIKQRLSSIAKGTKFITQGFVSATKDNRTTTLGRGGSDYSAALIAEGLGVTELYIYTDVPGVYTMDPNIVKQAHSIEVLSFQEMAEMANFGAKILHPATLEPCVRALIPIRILSTFEGELKGTYIAITQEQVNKPLVRAITMRKSQVLVTLKSLKMLDACGFLANVFAILAKYKISVDLITTSEVSIALTIDGTNFGSHGLNPFEDKALIQELAPFTEAIIEADLTLIAVIGAGLTIPGMVQGILGKLDSQLVRLICYGASSSSIGILVRKDDAVSIAQMLHLKLLERRE